MIIKLDPDTQNVSKARADVGDEFYRYILSDVYDKGEVVEVNPTSITVDFGDTVRSFEAAQCTLVFSASHLDHLMTCSEGEVVRDYRGEQSRAVEFDDFELDVGDWFV